MSLTPVPPISDGVTTLNEAGLGSSINALVTRTNELYAICGSKTNNAVVINDTGMSGVSGGMVVYFDTQSDCYKAAQPGSEVDSEGRILPGAAAYIAGLVLTGPNADGVGQLLVNGVIPANSISSALTAGPYFLASGGSLVNTPPDGALAIYCGYKTNTGWFIFNPTAPSPNITDQTVAAPVASIIPGPGINASTISRTVTLSTIISGATVSSGGVAVAAISNGAAVTCPVVNSITAGPGIAVNTTSGGAVISATGVANHLDFQIINANNVLIGGGYNDATITFPNNISGAAVVGTVRLPESLPSGGQIFAWISDTSEDLTVSGAIIYSVSGGLSSAIFSGTISAGGSIGTLSELTTGNVIGSAYNGGLVRVSISPVNTPTTDIHIIAAGVLVN